MARYKVKRYEVHEFVMDFECEDGMTDEEVFDAATNSLGGDYEEIFDSIMDTGREVVRLA